MTAYLLIISIVLIVCIVSSRISSKFGVPTLLVFIALGMLFGTDGIFHIPFENYEFAEQICSVALIYIMFYGGFGTNWDMAKPVAAKAILLSSIGVILTAVFTGGFCYLVLKTSLLEGMLIGAVIASTDAASVFAILRTKKLNLTGGLASILEVESGSNDPTAYMLTIVILGLMSGKGRGTGTIIYTIFAQIAYGLFFGFAIGLISVYILKKVRFNADGLRVVFVVAIALASYAIPALLGGNGFLSVYITGIILGNSNIMQKVELVHFFDGITGMMQILLFFLLGLLAFPSQLPGILIPALLIALFLTFVARPIAVFAILTPFKVPVKQQLLVSWAGLRGAASIVFAIYTVISDANMQNDIFHIVFCIALLSVALQGSFLPYIAKKLNLIDEEDNIFRTFNDYQEDMDISLIEMQIGENHSWVHKELCQISLLPGMLAVMIKRDHNTLIPNGSTKILPGDIVVLSCMKYNDQSNVQLTERVVSKKNPWVNKTLNDIDFPSNMLILMIEREGNKFIPKGDTVIRKEDLLVICLASETAAADLW